MAAESGRDSEDHFRREEIVARDVGDGRVSDEDQLRAEHGDDVLIGDVSAVAADWLRMRALAREVDPLLEDRVLHAYLLGIDELERRADEAFEAEDDGALGRALGDLAIVDPDSIRRALFEPWDESGAAVEPDDPEIGDDPPVIMPRSSLS